MSRPRVMIIDDESQIRDAISAILHRQGFAVLDCENGRQALEALSKSNVDVALVDLALAEMDGLETARRLKEIDPDLEIVILTGSASLESALQAIHEQVFDYLCKPVDSAVLRKAIDRAAEHRRLSLEQRQLFRQAEMERNDLRKQLALAKRALERQIARANFLIGDSPPMADARRFAAEAACGDSPILIRGENGTGKDTLARIIHEVSDRKLSGEFHKINCLILPETLLESELFGHEEGSFSGAERKKPGRLELANGGTIYLDEIGELSPALQEKLLQVIQQKQFLRIGGTRLIHASVRIIATTNAPLEVLIAEGRFRADLFRVFRENTITLPPLRERLADLPLLACHLLRKFGSRNNHEHLNLSEPVLDRMMSYDWPGNIRELEAVIRRFAMTGREESIFASISGFAEPPRIHVASFHPDNLLHDGTLLDSEVQTLMKALAEAHWNQRRAAVNLGISYSALRRRIAKHNLRDVK